MWIDDAVELLSRMRYTCSIDVVEDYPDGMEAGDMALVLGISQTAVDYEVIDAHGEWKNAATEAGLELEEALKR